MLRQSHKHLLGNGKAKQDSGTTRKTVTNSLSRSSYEGGGGGGGGGVSKVGWIILIVLILLILLVGYSAFLALRTFHEKTGHSIFAFKDQTIRVNDAPIRAVRREFYDLYGGKKEAQQILSRGIKMFGTFQSTAARILRAAAAKQPFVLSFAGYSVTVGRGNHLKQSYPFVLEKILQPVFQEALNLDVKVRNSAIGGIPSFPYGFCFEHFLGDDADVVSWDYSMNEGSGASILEAYIRQSQNQLPHNPMMIVLDTNKQRCQLLNDYVNEGFVKDGLCVGRAKDAVPKLDEILERQRIPEGFQDWDEFGAGRNCPGRGSWHPKKKEHELIGWMLAMYFVEALAVAQKIVTFDPEWQYKYGAKQMNKWKGGWEFPEPFEQPPKNPDEATHLLYGEPNSRGSTYRMKTVSCRTSFLPATDEDKVLPSIVVSGLAPGMTSENIMEPRSDATYTTGWVLDVSNVERETKVKVEKCGGLGYIDMKIALYGIPESGKLRLWLPVENFNEDDHQMASDWYDELIICEANEKRQSGACQLDKDITYTVGGIEVASTQMVSGAAEYLKRKTCVHVGIPEEAKVVRLKEVTIPNGPSITEDDKRRLSSNGSLRDDHMGLIVDLEAKKNVMRDRGACCVSHVVWAQH